MMCHMLRQLLLVLHADPLSLCFNDIQCIMPQTYLVRKHNAVVLFDSPESHVSRVYSQPIDTLK